MSQRHTYMLLLYPHISAEEPISLRQRSNIGLRLGSDLFPVLPRNCLRRNEISSGTYGYSPCLNISACIARAHTASGYQAQKRQRSQQVANIGWPTKPSRKDLDQIRSCSMRSQSLRRRQRATDNGSILRATYIDHIGLHYRSHDKLRTRPYGLLGLVELEHSANSHLDSLTELGAYRFDCLVRSFPC